VTIKKDGILTKCFHMVRLMAWHDVLRGASVRQPTVVTIGTFDGVHLGHQHLIAEVRRHAHALQASPVAITFNPRPAEVLRPDKPSIYLCSLDERCRRLRAAGAETVIPVPFTLELAGVGAEEFATELVRTLGMRGLVGGPDLAIGRGREGTVDVMRSIGGRLGFSVEILDGFAVGGQVVRTSAVRKSLSSGDVLLAAQLLGRRYAVEGVVVRGDGRGRTIGVPTANVATPTNIALPGNGVYAVRFQVDGRQLNGAANLGVRPTFDGAGRSFEVHLLDFDANIYDQHCTVEFVSRLRAEQRFGSVDELVGQIRRDIDDARRELTLDSSSRTT
jgi:riboflavin kinase/FMN adenylyltransferase